ncbi:MAG: calcium-translocating P-type ATPase, SERCA-type [Nanoarchaeota archaeon]|nr:calcium-translocating P-type ATPase, SERCA-type [Nanoarchaeota archaeon]
MKFYNRTSEGVLEFFKVSPEEGLTEHEVIAQRETYGINRLKAKKKVNPFMIFINQFRSFIIYILLFAVLISLLTGGYIDTIVILAILLFNAFFGFIQEYKAEKSIEALKKLSGLKSRVVRNGKTIFIDTKDLVPGDIILLEEGDKISADSRIIEAISLQVMEASLTGESMPVEKSEKVLAGELTIADRKNMLFSGTVVTKGRGKAVVTSIGMRTEIGKIAGMITELKKESTPLQKKLESLGKWIGLGTIIISMMVFIVGVTKEGLIPLLLSGQFFEFIVEAKTWFLIAIALAVAAVPEGLPAIVTIALALGVRRMLKRNSLIRRLPSVETLGETNVICADKTGTLTRNEMTIKRVYTNLKDIEVGGGGYEINGKATCSGKPISENDLLIFQIGVLCNNALLELDKKKLKIIGDPTEASLLVSAEKAGIRHDKFRKLWKRIDEEPFDSERKMMSTINKDPKTAKEYVFTKGASERVVEKCDRIMINGRVTRLRADIKKKILDKNDEFAKQALRVLAFAYKEHKKSESLESNLIFIGLQGMRDPPRKEVKGAIKTCKEAGIRVIMVTGDNRHTAEAIAKDIGIIGESIDGMEFMKLNGREQAKIISEVSIFSRVEPGHKMRIVELLQKEGNIVAMTGDGVNDAPALKKADIGIAMGIKGTDVAKETSDMILLDDNFVSIVSSVEEGRGIYENIKKFVNYLLSSNIAEVLVIFLAILFGWHLPMTAIMLLWINLVTDGLPALSLSVDPSPKDLMKRQPKKVRERIMNKSMTFNVLYVAILITIAVLGLFYWAMISYGSVDMEDGFYVRKIQTIAFTAIIVMEFVRLYTVRSEYHLGIFSNKYLVLAVVLSIALQLIVIYTPLNVFFGTTYLSVKDWLAIIGASAGVFVLNVIGIGLKNKIKWFRE